MGVERVLVVDWDIHHGNGTQKAFYDDADVLYFSIHRFDEAQFFPCSKSAGPDHCGRGAGHGANVNVAWNIALNDSTGMGDAEYLAAFQEVLLPIAGREGEVSSTKKPRKIRVNATEKTSLLRGFMRLEHGV